MTMTFMTYLMNYLTQNSRVVVHNIQTSTRCLLFSELQIFKYLKVNKTSILNKQPI